MITPSASSTIKVPSYSVSKGLLIANIVMALVYFCWWFLPGHVGNPWLHGLLVFGEIYHVIMAMLFWFTLWPTRGDSKVIVDNSHMSPRTGQTAIEEEKIVTDGPSQFATELGSVTTQGQTKESDRPQIDVFIPVAGEPTEIIARTAIAAKNMKGYAHTVYILNDGRVANKPNWEQVDQLANMLEVKCITRTVPGGAKAGNINNALRQTTGEFVVIFDADMVPSPQFLEETLPYFQNPAMGFVQTPQYYHNFATNEVTGGAWEQQELFFGPIMEGKNRTNSAFICGTNVVIRRQALMEVGGMCEDNIAEDFLTSLSIHQRGWKSHYINKVLSQGLAPEDMLAYYKQQLRWSRGSLEVLFGSNPLFKRGLSWSQKLQYLSSALYYANGLIVLIDIVMPLLFLFLGWQPVSATTTSFAVFFIPFMFLNLYTLYLASGKSVTYRAISFSQSSWTLQLLALCSVLTKQKQSFAVTAKKQQSGNFRYLAYPHLVYAGLALTGSLWAISRDGANPSVVTNIAWALFNVALFWPYIQAAFSRAPQADMPTASAQDLLMASEGGMP